MRLLCVAPYTIDNTATGQREHKQTLMTREQHMDMDDKAAPGRLRYVKCRAREWPLSLRTKALAQAFGMGASTRSTVRD